jgi:hypothetical protein
MCNRTRQNVVSFLFSSQNLSVQVEQECLCVPRILALKINVVLRDHNDVCVFTPFQPSNHLIHFVECGIQLMPLEANTASYIFIACDK